MISVSDTTNASAVLASAVLASAVLASACLARAVLVLGRRATTKTTIPYGAR
ncbi:MAG: hypothetical protein M1134_07580 [Actinobacteria bacterium]|nr:hypothetical protein [Actinomycetota bacterium]